ncbi:MAG: HDOD domain-containing protein [Proteobacteria bacterium]|nr:HDOD domain-containing protein [Pseudomonadota bacterium]
MEQFVARQPIFDRKQSIYAYELLFRSSMDNFFDHVDGDEASSRVIANSFLLFGIEEMTGGAKAFINFTRGVLLKGYGSLLPNQWTVVEVLENVEPDEEVLSACRRLKDQGFILALDDFVYDAKYESLLEMADIIKVDFLISDADERRRLAETFIPRGIKMLAEKVETREDFETALEQGYEYFQGYFFAKPVVVSRKDVPSFKLQYLRILKEINSPEVDFDKLAELIQTEVSISYKLLKYINSAAFGLREKIVSIKQALALLGENEVRKWASLLTLHGMASDKPAELVISSLIRAKFCEQLAPLMGMRNRASDFFMMGLFSMLDAIVDRPLKEILDELPVSDDIKTGLLGGRNKMRVVYETMLAFEKGRWEAVAKLAAALRVDEKQLPKAYIEAVEWSKHLFFD